jgi:type IV secretion system protein VirB1
MMIKDAQGSRSPLNKGRLIEPKPPLKPKHVWGIRIRLMPIIRGESEGNPFALNVNHAKVRPAVPKTAPEVAALAKESISRGFTVDLGLAQINSANLKHLGLTVERVLYPCTNLRAATILSANYAEAAKPHGPGQRALQAALSAYNTGDFARCFTNGYAQRF